MENDCLCDGYAEGRYVLPVLPYDMTALEPLLDAETVSIHHSKHHAAYVHGANIAAETLRKIAAGEEADKWTTSATRDFVFNLGGHLLHSLYWENICPVNQPLPEGKLAEALRTSFGSPERFLSMFRNVCLGVQGSGWGVLGVEPISRRLVIWGILRHQDVLVPGFRPLLVCDVWEHAYYLRYQNDRAAYLDAFLHQVNWQVVEERFNHCCMCHE